MPDYRTLFERTMIGAWDLIGKDCTLCIASVAVVQLTAPGGRASKKPVVHFEKTEKGLVLNRTNAKTIAAMYGNNTDSWIGKRVTLYPTQTSFGNEMVDAIRVRPTIPKGRQQKLDPQPVDPEMRAKQDRAAGRVREDKAQAPRPEFDKETGEELPLEDAKNDQMP